MKEYLNVKIWIRLICVAFFGVSAAWAKRTVIVDPGHGGQDHGAEWGMVYEKHLCLDTSARVAYFLKEKGYRVILTRTGDYFISLQQRVDIAKRYPDAVFVAVHYNKASSTGASGIETFFCNENSRGYATMVQNSIMKNIHAVNRGPKFARFYVIRHTTLPSILVECGFVSNEFERQMMKGGEYRSRLAKGIAEGVDQFCESL